MSQWGSAVLHSEDLGLGIGDSLLCIWGVGHVILRFAICVLVTSGARCLPGCEGQGNGVIGLLRCVELLSCWVRNGCGGLVHFLKCTHWVIRISNILYVMYGCGERERVSMWFLMPLKIDGVPLKMWEVATVENI